MTYSCRDAPRDILGTWCVFHLSQTVFNTSSLNSLIVSVVSLFIIHSIEIRWGKSFEFFLYLQHKHEDYIHILTFDWDNVHRNYKDRLCSDHNHNVTILVKVNEEFELHQSVLTSKQKRFVSIDKKIEQSFSLLECVDKRASVHFYSMFDRYILIDHYSSKFFLDHC